MQAITPATRRFIVEAPDRVQYESLDAVEASGVGQIHAKLPIINGVAVDVEAAREADLRAMAARMGLRVFEDRKVHIPDGEVVGTEIALPKQAFHMVDAARHTVGADAMWDKGVTGKGVAVAVIDTGVAPHKDLGNRIIAFQDFVNHRADAYDDHGHGTHVSGTIACDGRASRGYLKGVAPDADIVGIKVLDGAGSGEFSDVIAGIQWAVQNKEKYHIKVFNLSLGGAIEETYKDDPVVQAIEAAESAGILPVIAAGNSGPIAQTIGTPANAPHALSVAALDDRGTPWRWDDRMALFSSRGPTPIDGLAKPDVAAPGVAIVAPRANTNGYTSMSGTSMATPMTAGSAALLLSAHPEKTPAQVKAALMDSAHHLWGWGPNTQGRGAIDVPAALEQLEK